MYMTLIDTTTYKSSNYDERPHGEVSAIVIHTGEGTKASDLSTLTGAGTKKSAHYYIDRVGHIYQLVDPRHRAWHAGLSRYLNRTDWNDFAIGIESEHKAGQDWPSIQKQAFYDLCVMLIGRYSIQQQYIVAHRWIAPGRKPDPTNWPNGELTMWISGLYVKPSYTLPGLTGPMVCGLGFRDFYNAHGGLGMFGYALTPEAVDTDTLNRPCTWMRFERAVFKYVEGEGVHLALLVEASVKKWLT